MPIIPSAFDETHGINPWMQRLSPWFVLLMIGLVVFFQQFKLDLHSRKLSKPLPEIANIEHPEDPGIGALALTSKALVKRKAFELERGNQIDPDAAAEIMDFLDLLAKTRNDRLRVAIMAAELIGPEAAANRLATIVAEATPGGDLAREADILRGWYESFVKKRTFSIDDATREWILARQGWFGQVALSFEKPLSDDLRWEAASGFEAVSAFSGFMNILQFGSFVGGVVMLVVAISMLVSKRLTFVDGETVAPSHIYWETFGIFCLIFLIMLAIGVMTIGERGAWVIVVDEVAIWSAMFAIFWPRLRGVSLMELSDDMGFNKGAGWAKELGVGVAVFALGFPVALLTSLVVSGMTGEQPDEPIGIPMFEPPLQGSWVPLILGTLGASVWAPVLEEIMFRGALMGALRKSMGPVAAASLTAIVFGIYHPYDIVGIASVATGGLVYGLAKAWRGSLIAPIFAHFLWNTTIGVSQLGSTLLLD